MLAYYAPEKSEQGIANMLGLRTPWQAKAARGTHSFRFRRERRSRPFH